MKKNNIGDVSGDKVLGTFKDFSEKAEAGVISWESWQVFRNLTKKQHELLGKRENPFAMKTITAFMETNNIVSFIDNLIALVGDAMVASGRDLSSEKLSRGKTELESAREVTGISDLAGEDAEAELLKVSDKLPTLSEFIKKAHDADSGWHLTFIKVIDENGKERVATVRAYWRGGVLSVYWRWLHGEDRWNADYLLRLASEN